MSTYVQSESSDPTARDLLNLLHMMELEGKDLNVPLFYNEDDDGNGTFYVAWMGLLELNDDGVCLSYEPNDAIKAEHARLRQQAELEEANWRAAHPTPVDIERERLRREGLLP